MSEKVNIPYLPLKNTSFRDTITTSAASIKNALRDFLSTVHF